MSQIRKKEESIFYLCSKFHPDRCKFSVIIRLSKFTPNFWSRLSTFTLGFYNHPLGLFSAFRFVITGNNMVVDVLVEDEFLLVKKAFSTSSYMFIY